jgi:hypothetical protein
MNIPGSQQKNTTIQLRIDNYENGCLTIRLHNHYNIQIPSKYNKLKLLS